MSIYELKKKYSNDLIEKKQFIDQAFEIHSNLFSYMKAIDETDIDSIEIKNNQVLFHTKRDKLIFIVNGPDKRIAPIETINFNEYEEQEQSVILNLINDGDIVFDIGANIGWYSLTIAKRFANTKVHSFEPLPVIFDSLSRNVKINNLQNIHLNNFGLSNKTENVSFFYDSTFCSKSSLENLGETEAVKVDCFLTTLDSYVDTNMIQNIDFIKCDVEGAEIFALKGGLNSIKRFRPILFLEILRKWSAKFNYHPNDILNLMSELGYKSFGIGAHGVHEISIVDDNTIETNYIFLHNEKHESIIRHFYEK